MYLWVKALHLIFVVSWIAGLLIYPRYKLHQLRSQPGEALFDTMQEAAKKLRRIILAPSIAAVWILGLTLVALNPAVASGKWFMMKMVLVIAISAMHGMLLRIGRAIDEGNSNFSMTRLKVINEVPFVLFAIIAVLVIVQPF